MSSIEAGRLLRLRENALHGVKQTGYPHIDNPHMQYYAEESIIFNIFSDREMSMLDLIIGENSNNRNTIAIDYFGTKVTYRDFIKNVFSYAQTFERMGIKCGEVVSIASPNLPEVFYSIYGLNKIGAIANLIDPESDPEKIKQFINQVDSKRLIMVNSAYPKFDSLIHDTGVKEVYTVSPTDSLPLGLNYLQEAKTLVENHRKGIPNCPKNDLYHPLVQKINEVSKKSDINWNERMPRLNVGEEVAIIVNAVDANGNSKSVMLTNNNLNAVAIDCKVSGMDYIAGDKFLGIMPNYLVNGIGLGTHMALVLGLTNIVVPEVTMESLPKLIRKHRPDHFVGTPLSFQYLIEDKKMRGYDLSFIRTASACENVIDPELKQKTNTFLREHNCPYKVNTCYGYMEDSGVSISQYYVGESNEDNELNTVGIPGLNTLVRIVSPDTHEDLKYDEDGEILIGGKGVMYGYVNNPEETDKVIEEIDGQRYIHTGAIGHIDKNGCLYVVRRMQGTIACDSPVLKRTK